MTEQEWLTSEYPQAMLRAMEREWEKGGAYSLISDRKLRLFAAAMWRGHPGILTSHGASELPVLAERQADGIASPDEVRTARLTLGIDVDGGNLPYCVYVAQAARHLASVLLPGPRRGPEKRRQAALLRDIAGNPWRPVSVAPEEPGDVFAALSVLFKEASRSAGATYIKRAWLTPTVLSLAYAAYDERLSDGTLDPARLAVLADALEEAWCDNKDLLRHLRGEERRYDGGLWVGQWAKVPGCGPHVRGCWALSLILGQD